MEGSPRCYWAHTRRGCDRPRRLVTGSGRAGTCRKAGTDNRMGRAIRVGLAGAAVAARIRPGDDGHWAHFYFGPDADQDWVWISPGAVAATILWLLVSLLFKLYIANFTDYEASYGTVGGVIVVLLWFYISGIAILAGAELNAEIEHASPHGKAPGQKSAHGKLLIGQRAARAFRERQRSIESLESPFTRAPGPPMATRNADLVRIAMNAIVAVSWTRLAWKSTRTIRRAAFGAVVIGVALALGTRRARD